MMERDRRALIAGGVVLLGTVLAGSVPSLRARMQQAQERTRTRVETARGASAALAGASATRDSLRLALTEFVALAPKLVGGHTQSEAAATLISLINGVASRAALRVRRAESLADSGTGPIRPVRVRADLEGDIAGITQFLRDMEGRTPVLTIPSIAMTALEPSGPGGTETLRLEVTIGGWFVGGSETP
jgi:hypothetical protein